jgi:hypothetical protein
MPRERKSQEQVLSELPEDIKVEAEKDWLWVVEPELAPLHQVKGGCPCEECKARAAKRETLKLIGFRFAFADHNLASGKKSRWSHSCLRPTRFGKHNKNRNGASASEAPHRAEEPEVDQEWLNEASAAFQ